MANGNDSDDWLWGDAFDNTLRGFGGADVVSGAGGNDLLLDSDDHVLRGYDDGDLYYDADGNGATAPVLVATVSGAFFAGDIQII